MLLISKFILQNDMNGAGRSVDGGRVVKVVRVVKIVKVVKDFRVFIYVCFLKNHYICHA